MTIIVYRDGILAADDLVTQSPDGYFAGRTLKIAFRKKDRAIVAGCGNAYEMTDFVTKALESKEAFCDRQGYTGVVARPDGVVQEWTQGLHIDVRADYYAIGAGAAIAYGALAMGATAKQAVEIVCQKFGWPAEIHTLNHDGEFKSSPLTNHQLYDAARSSHDWDARFREPVPAKAPRKAGGKRNRRK